ncbi:MAG: hypothetical protein AAGK01_13295 [Pseudomonadota bacterium]
MRRNHFVVSHVSFNMTHHNTRLLIVYNADGGIFNALAHAVHKAVRPETYPCSLCAITYGAVSMRRKWRAFLDGLRMEKVFHHRDDFAADYPDHDFTLPVILIREFGEEPRVLVSSTELDQIADVDELIEIVDEKLVVERLNGPKLRAVA